MSKKHFSGRRIIDPEKLKIYCFLQVVFLSAILSTRCSKDQLIISDNDKATAEVKLNTFYNIKEVDNGFIISGVKDSKIYISKLDINFSTVWQKNNFDWGKLSDSGGWGSALYSVNVADIFQEENGNLVCFCSVMEGGDVVWFSGLIVMLDKFGNEISKIKLEETAILSVIRTSDNGYLLFGDKMIKLNSDLSKVWEKNDQGYFFSGANLSPMHEDGFAVTGTWNSEQVLLQKFDRTGTVQWTKKIFNKNPFNDLGYDVRQMSDKGFLIIGRTRAIREPWDMNCFLIRTDNAGDTIWTRKFGTGSNEWLEKFLYAAENDFIIQETVGFPGDPMQDSILLRINEDGQIVGTKELSFLQLLYTTAGYFVKVEQTGDGIVTFSKVLLDDLF